MLNRRAARAGAENGFGRSPSRQTLLYVAVGVEIDRPLRSPSAQLARGVLAGCVMVGLAFVARHVTAGRTSVRLGLAVFFGFSS